MVDYEYNPKILINENESMFWYLNNFVVNPDDFYNILMKDIKWEQHEGKWGDKPYLVPRLNYHMSDSLENYPFYGGTSVETNLWHPILLSLKDYLIENLNTELDSCIINYYPSGRYYIARHSDRESKGYAKVTIGISLGVTRDFILIKKGVQSVGITKVIDKNGITWERNNKNELYRIIYPTKAGDLYVMSGRIHELWEHEIPKRLKIKEGRISITYRKIFQ